MQLSTAERRTHIKLFENNVRMSEKLQGFVLFLPTIGGQDAVDILLDGIVCAEFLVDIFFRRRGGLARIMPDMSGTAYGFRMGMESFITSIAFLTNTS